MPISLEQWRAAVNRWVARIQRTLIIRRGVKRPPSCDSSQEGAPSPSGQPHSGEKKCMTKKKGRKKRKDKPAITTDDFYDGMIALAAIVAYLGKTEYKHSFDTTPVGPLKELLGYPGVGALLVVIMILLLRSGDVEVNPGPVERGTHILLNISSNPTFPQLDKLIVSSVASDWEQVATHLGVEPSVIDTVKADNPDHCEEACRGVLNRWLNAEPGSGMMERTWPSVLTVLEESGHRQVALQLRREHFGESSEGRTSEFTSPPVEGGGGRQVESFWLRKLYTSMMIDVLVDFILWHTTLVAFNIFLLLSLILHEYGLAHLTMGETWWKFKKTASLSGNRGISSPCQKTRVFLCIFVRCPLTVCMAVVKRYKHRAVSKQVCGLLAKLPSLRLQRGVKSVRKINGRLVVSFTVQRSFVMCIRSQPSTFCLAFLRRAACIRKWLSQAVFKPYVFLRGLLLLAGDVEPNPGPIQAEQVLMEYRDRFISEMDANTIIDEFLYKNIIPEGVQQRISKTDGPKQQNEILHAYLVRTCTDEALMRACGIIAAVPGNPKMATLVKDMQRSLESGVSGSGPRREYMAPSTAADPHVRGHPPEDMKYGAKPSMLDILRLVVPIIKEKWEGVGEALEVEHAVLNTVKYNEQRADGRALELLALWSQSAAGTGSLPRTWLSLLVAVETAVGPEKRERIEADLHQQSLSSAFDENCQKIVQSFFSQMQNHYVSMHTVQDEWFPNQAMSYVNLALASFRLDYQQAQKRFVEAVKEGADNVYTYQTSMVKCEAIPGLVKQHKLVILSGAPGVGKSTLARKVCQDVCRSPSCLRYSLVLLVELRKLLHFKKDFKLVDVLKLFQGMMGETTSPEELSKAIHGNLGRGVLFILDGFDELPPHLRQSDFLANLLSHNLECSAPLPYCHVIMTSRSIVTSEVYHKVRRNITNVEVLGFTQEQIKEYAGHILVDQGRPDLLDSFVRKIDSAPEIRGLCSIPVVLSIICQVFLFREDLPPTLTQFYNEYLCVKILKYCKDLSTLNSILDLPRYHDMYKLGEIAYNCIQSQKIVFNSADLQGLGERFSDRERGCGVLTARPVQADPRYEKAVIKSFFFIYLTVQEFIAAVYVALLPAEMQREIWAKYLGEPHMAQVWRFYCGLTNLEHFELLQDKITAYPKDFQMQCLFESQNASLVRQLMPHIVGEEVTVKPNTVYDSTAYGYCLSKHPALRRLSIDIQRGGGSAEFHRLLEPVYFSSLLQTLHLEGHRDSNWMEIEVALDRLVSQEKEASTGDSHKDGALKGHFGKVELEFPPLSVVVKVLCLQHVQEIECWQVQEEYEDEYSGKDVSDPGMLLSLEEAVRQNRSLTGIKLDCSQWKRTDVATAILKGAAKNTILRELMLVTPEDSPPPQDLIDAVKRTNLKLQLLVGARQTTKENNSVDTREDRVSQPDQEWQEFEQHYAHAIESYANVRLNVTKCTTIGPPRVGKTCLKYLLTNQKWDVQDGTASTDVMEAPEWVECCSIEKGGANKLWRLMSKEEIQTATLKTIDKVWTEPVAELEFDSTPTPGMKSPTQPTTSTVSEQPAVASNIAEQGTAASTMAKQYTVASTSTEQPTAFSTSAGQVTGTPTRSSNAATPDSEVPVTLSCMQCLEAISQCNSKDLLQRLKDKGGMVLGSTELIYFVDTGGQAIYHDVHPVLITSPSVYLVVFSLNDFYGKTDDKKLMSEYFRSSLIQRPLRSIQTFGCETTESDKRGFPQDPKIFIIGTHLDVLPQGNDRVKTLDHLHQIIAEEISHTPYRQFVQYDWDGRSFWAVDNTEAGKGQKIESAHENYISLLRERIQDKRMMMSRKVPIPWFLLRLVMISNGVQYCTYSQLLKEAESMGYIRKGSQAEGLDAMLKLFHMLGLVYYRIPEGSTKGESLVFIDPDCLFSTTTNFLMAAKEELKDINRSSGDELDHFVLKPNVDSPPRPRKRRIQLADPFKETVECEMHQKCKSQSSSKRRKIERSLLEKQCFRGTAAGIVETDKVMQRMETNLMHIWKETAVLLQKVESTMINLHQAPMSTVLERIGVNLKEEKDPSEVTSSGHYVTTWKGITLSQRLWSHLRASLTVGDIAQVKQQVHKALNDFWCNCRKRRKSIQSTDMPLFLALLSDLRIIAKVHGSQFTDSDCYVIPSALPMSKESKATRITNPNSILITVLSQSILRTCYLPSGLFCALISCLVTTSGWNIIPLDREHVFFTHESVHGQVHVIEWDPFLEIYLEVKASLDPQALKDSCRFIKMTLDEALRDVYSKFFCHPLPLAASVNPSPIIWGFPCKAHPWPDEKTHIAAFQRDEDECWAECLLEGSIALQPVSTEQLLWFQ